MLCTKFGLIVLVVLEKKVKMRKVYDNDNTNNDKRQTTDNFCALNVTKYSLTFKVNAKLSVLRIK